MCLLALSLLVAKSGVSQAKLQFDDTKKSFGFVKKGEVVVIDFTFQNTGITPLIINDAKTECSCTTIDFPKQPVAPGQKGTIKVSFDTKSVYDRQDRTVEIVSNAAGSPQKIRFRGVVLKP